MNPSLRPTCAAEKEFSLALGRAIRRCKKTRRQIADEMTLALGIVVTERMLNGWSAESREDHRFPASYLPQLCIVLGSDAPLRFLLKGTRLAKFVTFAEAEIKAQRSQAEANRLRQEATR